MFYNCISFLFFPYERELNINKYDEGFLGILITKFLKYNKEIIISNINEDNEGYINLCKNKIKVEDKRKEIIILDGKDDDRELIACFKYEKKGYEDELIVLYENDNNNENNDEHEIKINIRIINKLKDMIYFMDVILYHLYLIFQNGIQIMLLIWNLYFMIVNLYHLYLIFQNGIQIMLLI